MMEVFLEVLLFRHELFKFTSAIVDWLFHKGLVLLFLFCIKRRQLFYANLVKIVGRQIHAKFLPVSWVGKDHSKVRPNVTFKRSIELELHWDLKPTELSFYIQKALGYLLKSHIVELRLYLHGFDTRVNLLQNVYRRRRQDRCKTLIFGDFLDELHHSAKLLGLPFKIVVELLQEVHNFGFRLKAARTLVTSKSVCFVDNFERQIKE